MGEPTRISSIFSVFNNGRFIKEAINSVFAKTYQHNEMIVVDGGLTNDTASIVRNYDITPS